MANTAVTGHSVPHGKTLIEKIQDKADQAYKSWDNKRELPRDREFGRVEGVCAALGILRGTSTATEIEHVKERLGAQ